MPRIVYRVAGSGTDEFSRLKATDTVDILGNLGNGFPLEKAEGKCAVLMGGGTAKAGKRRVRESAAARKAVTSVLIFFMINTS